MGIAGGIKTALSGERAKAAPIKVGDAQLRVLEELEATGSMTIMQLQQVLEVPRKFEMERRVSSLIKKGFVHWKQEAPAAMQYYISGDGTRYLRKLPSSRG